MRIYWQLVRPGLLAAVLFSMAMAACIAGESIPPWPLLAHSLAGTGLLIAGAVAMNQRMEHGSDARMARTENRPLPSRNLTVGNVTAFAVVTSIAGTGYLAVWTTATMTAMAVLSWIIYVLIYTPLKRRTVWQTPVGAISGAIPMLLGAAVADALWEPTAWILFGILFCWQFPHTMAIAWRYRRQYAGTSVQVATVRDPAGRLAGWLAVGGAAGLLLVSLVSAIILSAGWTYGIVAVCLGLPHLILAIRFLHQPNDGSARVMGRMAMAHLPLLLGVLLWAVRG